MTSAPLTPQEEVELALIAADASDAARMLLAVRGHQDAGVFPYVTMPAVALVLEESYRYLSRKSTDSALFLPRPELFKTFARTVTKARARLKLFDDTDGYDKGLIEALAMAHAKSVEWFNERHRGIWRWWIRYCQPDLGIYFLGEDVIATTHTSLPGMGITLDELRALTPSELWNLGKRQYAFGHEAGAYLRQLATLLTSLGVHVQLQHTNLDLSDIRLTHTDFMGAKVYKRVNETLHPNDSQMTGAVVMALAQINGTLRVLPQLVAPTSNLLFRLQFLSAYHAGNTLNSAIPRLMREMPVFTEAERRVLTCRRLRNVCAHYGLGAAGVAAAGAEDPFSTVIGALASMSPFEVSTLIERWLTAASTIIGARVSKTSLSPLRARFGDNS